MLLILAACSHLPTATFSTSTGCGLAQWDETWAKTNIGSVTWDGSCKDGLTQGNGTLVATMKSGNPLRFTGQMQNGKYKEGSLLRIDGWELKGEFVSGHFYKGTIDRAAGVPFYQGTMILYKKLPSGGFIGYSDQRFDEGKLYLTDGSYVDEGRWDGSIGQYALSLDAIKAGRGIIWGKYYNGQNVLQYQMVGGTRYTNDASYRQAKAEYAKREALATEQANQAYAAELQRKSDEDRRLALGALAAGLATPGTSRDRTQAMTNALTGNTSASSNSSSNAGGTTYQMPGSAGTCEREIDEWIVAYNAVWPISDPKRRIGAKEKQSAMDHVSKSSCNGTSVAAAKQERARVERIVNDTRPRIVESEKNIQKFSSYKQDSMNAHAVANFKMDRASQIKRICMERAWLERCHPPGR